MQSKKKASPPKYPYWKMRMSKKEQRLLLRDAKRNGFDDRAKYVRNLIEAERMILVDMKYFT